MRPSARVSGNPILELFLMLQLMGSFPKQEESFKKNFIPKALIHIQTESKLHISYLHLDVEFNHDLLNQ